MKRIVCLCAALVGFAFTMQAQTCELSVATSAVAQGTEGELALMLTNETAISGGQFTVTFPEGITIKNITLNGERSSGHTLEYRLNEDSNSAKVLFYAQPTAPLKENSGALCILTIAADVAMNSGEYQVTLDNVQMAADATTTVNATTTDGTLMVTARYQITLAAGEGGSVTGEGIYDAGDTVTLAAIPNEGYHFVKWSDGSTDSPYSFEATEDIHLAAEFAPNIYALTYVVDGETYKTYELEYGATITAEEEPTREGYTFSGWSEIPETMPAHDVTISGTFTANVYKVTYILDGEVFKVEEVVYGAAIPTPEVPAKEGYNFSGWGEVPESMPAHDLTLTGSYTINKDMKYDLIYMVDGVEYKRVTLSFGDAIVLEEEPTKEGHTFSGWSEVPETMPLHDVTVTGSFTANSYTLTYVLDDETFKTEEVVYGTTIMTPEAPAKEGYTFGGWENVPETMPAEDVTITGSYTINKYTLTYTVDGETYKTYELEYGAIMTAEEEPTKEGHTFSGWSEIPETMPAKDVTVTGTFTANVYKVTYILDGEVFKVEEVVYGTAIPTPEVPAKEGYNFSGWGEVPESMPAHDLTLTGSYTINKDMKYDLIYMVDGVEYKRVTLSFGDAIVLEEEPTKEGHTFSGWSEVPETMPLHDVTVTGSFTANSYTLTYVLDGETFKTEEVVYGTTIITPEAPAKEGYTFGGWENVPETMPANDVTISGTFTVNKYLVTFKIGDEVITSDSLEYGTAIIAPEAPEREGHTFNGWGEVAETVSANDVIYEGSYTINTYKVYYYVGEELVHSEEVTYGEIIPEYTYEPEEGYTFLGWIGESYETMPAHDVTYTANIESGIDSPIASGQQQTVIYDLTGRKVTDTQNLKGGIYIVNGKKVVIK